MSKFLRTMTALSKKPSDFQKKEAPEPAPVSAGAAEMNPETPGPPPKLAPVAERQASAREATPIIAIPEVPPGIVPYMEVEGRGKRPLHFCRTVQDAHTAGEQLAYQAIWNE